MICITDFLTHIRLTMKLQKEKSLRFYIIIPKKTLLPTLQSSVCFPKEMFLRQWKI